MTKLNQIYKCEVCGNIIEMVHASDGKLVCCGKPMILQKEQTEEQGTEKHKPVVEGATVNIGSIPHPMEKEHYIEWVEALEGDDVCRKNLKPGDKPQAEFSEGIKKARAYCNIHGLWTN